MVDGCWVIVDGVGMADGKWVMADSFGDGGLVGGEWFIVDGSVVNFESSSGAANQSSRARSRAQVRETLMQGRRRLMIS